MEDEDIPPYQSLSGSVSVGLATPSQFDGTGTSAESDAPGPFVMGRSGRSMEEQYQADRRAGLIPNMSSSNPPFNRPKTIFEKAPQSWPPRPLAIQPDNSYEISPERRLHLLHQFSTISSHINTIRGSGTKEHRAAIFSELENGMIRAIHESNKIDGVGLPYRLTEEICRGVFNNDFDLFMIPTGYFPLYVNQARVYRFLVKPELDEVDWVNILRAHNEVVQHAKAFRHIMETFVFNSKPLSEELIHETHRILMGHDDLNASLGEAERIGTIDPFSIASRFLREFDQSHPYMEGNGRLSRLILSAIICRYTGVVVGVGGANEYQIERFKMIKDRDGLALLVLEKAAPALERMAGQAVAARRRDLGHIGEEVEAYHQAGDSSSGFPGFTPDDSDSDVPQYLPIYGVDLPFVDNGVLIPDGLPHGGHRVV